jgi:hypothetical protein
MRGPGRSTAWLLEFVPQRAIAVLSRRRQARPTTEAADGRLGRRRSPGRGARLALDQRHHLHADRVASRFFVSQESMLLRIG